MGPPHAPCSRSVIFLDTSKFQGGVYALNSGEGSLVQERGSCRSNMDASRGCSRERGGLILRCALICRILLPASDK